MSDLVSSPELDEYLSLFERYRERTQVDFGRTYLEPEDERYRLLFDQICRLLVRVSRFNLEMPQEFRRTAHRYLSGEPTTAGRMGTPAMRHFMLSDLYDYLCLRRMGGAP